MFAVFSAVSGVELAMSKEHHKCKIFALTIYLLFLPLCLFHCLYFQQKVYSDIEFVEFLFAC